MLRNRNARRAWFDAAAAAIGEPATLMDLLPLWSDFKFRARVAGMVTDDPVLAGFFAWLDGLGVAERNFIIAAPLNKVRPLLQLAVVEGSGQAPRSAPE